MLLQRFIRIQCSTLISPTMASCNTAPANALTQSPKWWSRGHIMLNNLTVNKRPGFSLVCNYPPKNTSPAAPSCSLCLASQHHADLMSRSLQMILFSSAGWRHELISSVVQQHRPVQSPGILHLEWKEVFPSERGFPFEVQVRDHLLDPECCQLKALH